MTILGVTRPRIFTPPLEANSRGLPRWSRGREFIRWAREFGEPLRPWQQELAIRALETVGPAGPLRFRVVVVIVARQNGKTTFLRLFALWLLLRCGVRLVVAAAQDRGRAFETWEDAVEALEAHPTFADRVYKVWRRTNQEYLRVTDADGRPGGRYLIKAATRSSGRGPSADAVLFDELREQDDWAGWAALSKTTMAREDGILIAFSNAGDRRAVVLRHLRSVAQAGTDPAVGLFEWSAPEGCDLLDMRAVAMANPTLNRPGGITEAAVRTAAATDPAEIYRAEVLCQFVGAADHAVDVSAWLALADPELDSPRRDWVMVVDVAPDGEHATAALAAVVPDGRVRVEVARAWRPEGSTPATELARRELRDLVGEVRPRLVGWFPSGPAKAIGTVLRSLTGVTVHEIKGQQVSEACMGFADLVSARLIVHPADDLLTAHVTGADKLPEGSDGAWRFVRSGAAHCDAAYAAAGAVYLALLHPVRRRPPMRMILPRRVVEESNAV